MDIGAIRTALAAVASGVSNIRAYATAPGTVDPGPRAAVVFAPTGPFASIVTLDGARDVSIHAIVLTSKASERAGQNRNDQLAKDLVDAFTLTATSLWDYVMPGTPFGYGDYVFGPSGHGGALPNSVLFYGFTIPLTVACS